MKYPIILALALFVSCSTPRIAPRFTAPAIAPVKESVVKIQQHVGDARKTAQDLKVEIAKQPLGNLTLAQPYVDTLLVQLDSAYNETNVLHGKVDQLTTEVVAQTKKANNLADQFDKSAAALQRQHASIVRLWKLLALSTVLNLAAVGWIFRRPIGAMFGI